MLDMKLSFVRHEVKHFVLKMLFLIIVISIINTIHHLKYGGNVISNVNMVNGMMGSFFYAFMVLIKMLQNSLTNPC